MIYIVVNYIVVNSSKLQITESRPVDKSGPMYFARY